jgi:hypothetical protein
VKTACRNFARGKSLVAGVPTELEHASMTKSTLAALAVLVVMQSSLAAMAADRDRVVGCREQCSRQPCQASPAECQRFLRACEAACN